MTEQTITYSSLSEGWTSFWSYHPDWMIGMNNTFYTWKDGNLYKHNSNATRNMFYGTQYTSSVTSVFNEAPTEVKLYKTLQLNSNKPWTATISTDMMDGGIDYSYYKEKEDQWYGYIRRVDGTIDLQSMSTQGIGSMLSYSALTLNFAFNIGTSISQFDKVYVIKNNALVLLGEAASHTVSSITLSSIGSTIPSANDIIVFVKNSVAESYGSRGYYMSVKLENPDTTQVQLFSVTASEFKSYP
jgi:hypothetical protein